MRILTGEQVEQELTGMYYFDRETFRQVVLRTPDVSPEVAQEVIDHVLAEASRSDATVDVYRAGKALGELLATSPNRSEVLQVAAWVNDLDRLPMFSTSGGDPHVAKEA